MGVLVIAYDFIAQWLILPNFANSNMFIAYKTFTLIITIRIVSITRDV